MAKCVNHPIKQAVAHCKRCNDPLCLDCRVKAPEGIFCSDGCVKEFREFQGKVYAGLPKSGRSFSFFGLLRNLVISAVLIVFIWFVLTTWLGTDDPGEMGERLGQMLKLIF